MPAAQVLTPSKHIMKKTQILIVALHWLSASLLGLSAQDARFFRVTGPAPVTITGISPYGFITWTNATASATFTVQTASSLAGVGNWVDFVQVPVTNMAVTQRLFDPNPPSGMAIIPAGSFLMGDSMDSSSIALPLHTVYISEFYMDKYEVTKALWDDVYNWATNHGYAFDNAGSGKAANNPVQTIDWNDCVKWCNARSQKDNLTPCYYTDKEQQTIYKTGTFDLTNGCVKWTANGYRLPTEAEWEKAARGGVKGQRFSWGNTITQSQANYRSFANGEAFDISPTRGFDPTFNDGVPPYTSPVGYFAPNGYGLCDMTGNVWEWCWDWYGAYSSNSQTDPRGSESGSYRMYRGGGWGDDGIWCRASDRSYYAPSGSSYFVGFRSVRISGQ